MLPSLEEIELDETTLVLGRDEPFCPYCAQAKSFLARENIPFVYKSINGDYTREELFDLIPTAKTFPQIFVKGKYVGGFTELQAFFTELKAR